MGRYDKVAQYFTSKGYVVCGIDIIGHGHSLQNGSRKAYLGKKGSWEYVVKDVHTCYTEMKKRYPKLPYYIVGFSMGSFIVRDMLLSPHLRTK
ncbi:MAG: alpha/beta fold hydrolase, partial [Lachnospira pectinoschiza]